jgi:hypothetical protein
MRVCTTGQGSGSDLGAGGSGNEASGGEMEYDGRVAGIGVSAGKEGDMGRSGQINRRWWETGGLDVVQLVVRANGYLLCLSRRSALT